MEDACEFIIDAEHKTAPFQKEGYPNIRTPNIGKGRLILDGVFRVSEETYRRWTKRAIPQPNDLILAREAPVGNVAIIPEDELVCLGQRTVLLRPDTQKANPHFLCYFLLSDKMQNLMLGKSGGSTVAHLNMKDIRALELGELPPLPTQRKIAAILSAYDDLIENNLKRIRLLEEAAQHLYREWFVRFRFPGWGGVRVVDGLPEGWEKCSFFDVAEIMSGGTPKTDRKEFWDGDIPFFTPKDGSGNNSIYINQTERRVTEEGLKNCNSRLYPKDTIFITARGTVGRICLAAVPMAMSQSSFALSGKDGIGPFFLCSALQNSVEHFRKFAVGGVFDTIIIDTFKKIECFKPTKELIAYFEKIATPMFSQIETLHFQNQKLKVARDLLLPRLMNQTIEV